MRRFGKTRSLALLQATLLLTQPEYNAFIRSSDEGGERLFDFIVAHVHEVLEQKQLSAEKLTVIKPYKITWLSDTGHLNTINFEPALSHPKRRVSDVIIFEETAGPFI